MKLYRTDWTDDDPQEGLSAHQCRYTGTQADCKELAKSLKGQFMRQIRSEEVEVPTHKAGLLEFLNTNCV